jgi:hypothetical protein
MIEFVTLLLALQIGVRPVEVSVTGPVAAVELHVDDRTTLRRNGPPWTFPVDLGQELLPHKLVAVALDAEGEELDRAVQWVNYARDSFEATIVLEDATALTDSEGDGPPRGGRVVWASALDRDPLRIDLTFDGDPLEVDPSDGGFRLPAYDLGDVHYLRAEVEFSAGPVATAESIFGGVYGEQVTSALTAVTLRVPAGTELPPPAEVAGWLRVRGEPVSAFSTETAGAEVVVVRDNHIDPNLRALTRKRPERVFARAGKIWDGEEVEAVTAGFVLTAPLPRDPPHVFRTVEVEPVDVEAGLWSLAYHRYPRYKQPATQHLAWATALAGKHLADAKRPRAVVLLLAKRPKDASSISFGQAWGFLRALRVPVFVWVPEEKTLERIGGAPEGRVFIGVDGMLELFAAVDAELGSQRTVWLEGEHLPRDVTLSPDAPEGVALVE